MPRTPFPFPHFISDQTPIAEAQCEILVQFRDCDPMGILWHGNYLAYVEHARHQLGCEHGYGVDDLLGNDVYAPIVRSQVQHHAPAQPGDTITVVTQLYPTLQPRLYHRYSCFINDKCCAVAETEQVLTDHDMQLILTQPDWLTKIVAR